MVELEIIERTGWTREYIANLSVQWFLNVATIDDAKNRARNSMKNKKRT